MSKRKSDGLAAESPSLPAIVCTLVIKTILDDCEVELHCQRTDGIDRVFSTSMDWLCAERPSESTLAASAAILLSGIIPKFLRFVGTPVDVRAGLLSKKHVEEIINGVCHEMDETKIENEKWQAAEIVTKVADLDLAPEASALIQGNWIAHCPGTSHTLELQPKRNLFFCGYCKVGGGIEKFEEFSARRNAKPRLGLISSR